MRVQTEVNKAAKDRSFSEVQKEGLSCLLSFMVLGFEEGYNDLEIREYGVRMSICFSTGGSCISSKIGFV